MRYMGTFVVKFTKMQNFTSSGYEVKTEVFFLSFFFLLLSTLSTDFGVNMLRVAFRDLASFAVHPSPC